MAQNNGGIFKWILGCGCLFLVLAMIGIGLFGWGTYMASKKIAQYAESKVNTTEMAKLRKEFKIPEVAREQVVKAFERPLEQHDVDRFLALNDWYYEQPANEKAAKLMELDWSNPSGFVEVLSDTDAQKQVQDLLRAFPGQVEKQGGWSVAIDSSVRTVALAAISDAVGTATGKDAASLEVARLLLKNSSKVQDPKFLSALGVDAEKTKTLTPLLSVLKHAPRASFENWSKLPQDKRTRVVAAWRRQSRAVLAAKLNPVLNTCRALGVCS